MASRYEVEVTIGSARELKNVNWRRGNLKAYAVAWIEGGGKFSTKVDVDNDVSPVWDEKLALPLPPDRRPEDAVLCVDVVHADAKDGTKPLVGSAKLRLRDVLDDVGLGGKSVRSLKLKRPSGRPHGRLDIKVAVKEPSRYNSYERQAPPYGQSASRDYRGGYGYGQPYSAPPPPPPQPAGYAYTAPPQPAGYPYTAPPAPAGYPYYGAAPSGYGGAPSYAAAAPAPRKSKFGMGTGLAVGAAAGLIGGIALTEGVEHIEDRIADKTEERVDDDLANSGYDDYNDYGGDYGGDDF